MLPHSCRFGEEVRYGLSLQTSTLYPDYWFLRMRVHCQRQTGILRGHWELQVGAPDPPRELAVLCSACRPLLRPVSRPVRFVGPHRVSPSFFMRPGTTIHYVRELTGLFVSSDRNDGRVVTHRARLRSLRAGYRISNPQS